MVVDRPGHRADLADLHHQEHEDADRRTRRAVDERDPRPRRRLRRDGRRPAHHRRRAELEHHDVDPDPDVGAGVITLRNAYPVTLGANVGTTITALLAALAASRPEALTIALVHTTFNVVGILILYVIPILRPLPIMAAERLADLAVKSRMIAVAYVVGVFIVVPLIGVAVFR